MKPGMLIVAVATLVTAGWIGSSSRSEPRAVAAPGQRTPVIVELFTSEGCSSCPSADAMLMRLVRTQPVPGAEIIPLGEHVDYWNSGGWSDPYSSHGFSVRQADYSRHFGLNEVYTPQMIVDGQAQFVGSDEGSAVAAIERAARQEAAEVRIEKTAGGAASAPENLEFTIDHIPAIHGGDRLDVVLAVTEEGLHSSVAGGENAGRNLSHTGVVRLLRGVGSVPPGASRFTGTTRFQVDPRWQRENTRAVIFLQERSGHRIVGAAAVRLG